jgi:hypothetical protein
LCSQTGTQGTLFASVKEINFNPNPGPQLLANDTKLGPKVNIRFCIESVSPTFQYGA